MKILYQVYVQREHRNVGFGYNFMQQMSLQQMFIFYIVLLGYNLQ